MKRNFTSCLQKENDTHPTPGSPVQLFANGQSPRRDGVNICNNSDSDDLYIAWENEGDVTETLDTYVSSSMNDAKLVPGEDKFFPMKSGIVFIVDSQNGAGSYTAREMTCG